MTRKSIKIGFMAVFCMTLFAAVLWISYSKPRVLILQSYSTDYVWTRNIDVGLERVLGNQSWLDIHYHYMKTKKRSYKRYLERAGIGARNAIDQIRPDVLIAIDDYAQKLAAKYYVNKPGIQIVFAGVNGSAKPYGYTGAKNVTGIYERKPVRALRDAVKVMGKSGNPRALFLSDKSHSAARDAGYMAEFNWEPVRYQGHQAVRTFRQWQDAIKQLKDKTDVLFVGAYRKLYADDLKSKVPAHVVMAWTVKNSPVPVVGINDFVTEDGAFFSVGVSPYEQGEVAAKMALRILQEKIPAEKIQRVRSTQYVVAMRRTELEASGIKVPTVYEALAQATGNYFE
jgi:ABC-type uncharacterized transport system substrate-binding protein